LQAAAWQDAQVPEIALLDLFRQPTLTSAVHCQIESLLEAGVSLAGLTVDEENGWSDDQVNSIQTELNFHPSNVTTETRFDTGVPRAFIVIRPAAVVADADTQWEAGIEGEAVSSVSWRFTFPSTVIQPSVLNRVGNPVRVALFLAGDWTVRAEITRANGSLRTFETVITVGESLFGRIAGLHRRLSQRDLAPPLNAIGSFRIGTTTFKLLQYELEFRVSQEELATHRIVIKDLDKTEAQWQFRANGTEQGLIDYRLRIQFESKDFRLQGLLGSLVTIESVDASFFYGRSYTPGILMNDTRSAVPLTGADGSSDGLRRGDDSASVPRLASALTTRPIGNATITEADAKVKVSMLPQAIVASVIVLLLGFGAMTAAAILGALNTQLIIAIAAGPMFAPSVIVLAVAIFLFIAFVVPPIVENAIAQNIRDGMTSQDAMDGLEEARLLQFAGEGIAEAVSRQVIAKANESEDDPTLDPPPVASDAIGHDRYRQDLYQMIHVSEGRCRVLVRA
jgi:hypothetical protein